MESSFIKSIQTPEQPTPTTTPNAPKKATAAKRRIQVEEPKERNSNGFEIVSIPGVNVPNPTKKVKMTPTERQISPAYKVSSEINVYCLTKKWDKASKDYVQVERSYVGSSNGKPGVYTFSFDICYIQTMIAALNQLKEYYSNDPDTDDDSDDGTGQDDDVVFEEDED